MLTYATDEFAPYLKDVVVDAGWAEPGEDLLALGDLPAALATVGRITDLQQVVSIGDPNGPRAALTDALLQAPANLLLTDTVGCEHLWRWYASSREITDLILDETAFAECRAQVQALGLPYRIVETSASWVDRLRQSSWGSAFLAIEGHHPEGLRPAPQLPDIVKRSFYGLVSGAQRPDFASPERTLCWGAWTPPARSQGVLADALGYISSLGADLRHIRSVRLGSLRRAFVAVLAFPDPARAAELRDHFTAADVRSRILAQVPDPQVDDDEATLLQPSWSA